MSALFPENLAVSYERGASAESDDSSRELSAVAEGVIRKELDLLAHLERETGRLHNLSREHLFSPVIREHVLRGIGAPSLREISPEGAFEVWTEKGGVAAYDREQAVRGAVDETLREVVEQMTRSVKLGLRRERGEWSPELLLSYREAMPLFVRLIGVRSRSELSRRFGKGGSQRTMSRPMAERLSQELKDVGCCEEHLKEKDVVSLMSSTLEGIARDAMGRHFLESLVATALKKEGLPFQPEAGSDPLRGKYHKTKVDFVYPNAREPQVMIAVRKSSPRHSQLYSKELWGVALDLKSRYPDLVCVLLTQGEWSAPALNTVRGVFDVVRPVDDAPEVASELGSHLRGEKNLVRHKITLEIKTIDEPTAKISRR